MFSLSLQNRLLFLLTTIMAGIFPLVANPFFAPVFTLPKVWFFWAASSFSLLILSFYRTENKIGVIFFPVFAYLAIAIISLFMAGSKAIGFFGEYARWDGFLTISLSLVLFVIPIIALTIDQVVVCLKALMASSLLISLIAIFERFFKNPFLILTKTYDPAGYGALNTMDMTRSVSTFGSPLYLAAFLIMAIPVSMYFAASDKKGEKVLGSSALVLSLAALVLTFSRGAWLGFIASILYLGFYHRKSFLNLAKNLALPFVTFLILTAGILILLPQQYSPLQRFVSIFKAESGARPGIWDSTLKMISEEPLFGYGPDSFKNNFTKFKQPGWNIDMRQPVPDKAHNEVFQQAATVGIMGLSAIIWLFIFIFFKIKSSLRNSQDNNRFSPAVFLFAGALAYLVQSLFNFFQISTAPIFWLIAGMALSMAFRFADGGTITINDFGIKNIFTYLRITLSGIIFVAVFVLANFLYLADYNFQKALDYLDKNNYKTVIAYLANSVRFFPFEERYFVILGKASTEQFKIDNTEYVLNIAEEAFSRAEKLNPLSVETLLSKANLYSTAWLYKRDKKFIDKAAKVYNKSLKLDPENIEAYLGMGVIKAYSNDFREAISFWEKALVIDPSSANVYFNLGWAYENLGEHDKAYDAYKEALGLAPSMAEAREGKKRVVELLKKKGANSKKTL